MATWIAIPVGILTFITLQTQDIAKSQLEKKNHKEDLSWLKPTQLTQLEQGAKQKALFLIRLPNRHLDF